ncbi:MAG: hypothetical protein A2528_03385 [Candidatus Staskawiczbacteria bacterium RIFOXYD2_FULL_37_9]|nr:MAG: hypothetical protein A2528_03385 [Candidatus Staskawiczbacteria bacterium RIFOXYD2_FULL_37_9]
MIDTLTLQIERLDIPDKNLQFFKASRSEGRIKYIFNPDSSLGAYLPRITVKKAEGQSGLYTVSTDIEFSAPKILHNTNYYGISQTDKNLFTDALYDKLCYIFRGSPIKKEMLDYANIKNIAFSFNFILSQNYGYPIEYLKVIPFLDIGKNYNKRKDTFYTESDRFGFCGRIYNKQVSWKMYDKGAEIIANAKNRTEKDIAIKLKHGQLPDKIIRMEITYQNRYTLKRHLKTRIGGTYGQERHFAEVFNDKLCQDILLESFDKINNTLNIRAMDTPLLPIHEFFKRTKQANMPLENAYTWLGRCLATQQAGSQQLKLISDEFYTRQQRAKADEKIKELISKYSLPSFTLKQVFDDCRTQLVDFKIMKPDDTCLIKN